MALIAQPAPRREQNPPAKPRAARAEAHRLPDPNPKARGAAACPSAEPRGSFPSHKPLMQFSFPNSQAMIHGSTNSLRVSHASSALLIIKGCACAREGWLLGRHTHGQCMRPWDAWGCSGRRDEGQQTGITSGCFGSALARCVSVVLFLLLLKSSLADKAVPRGCAAGGQPSGCSQSKHHYFSGEKSLFEQQQNLSFTKSFPFSKRSCSMHLLCEEQKALQLQ